MRNRNSKFQNKANTGTLSRVVFLFFATVTSNVPVSSKNLSHLPFNFSRMTRIMHGYPIEWMTAPYQVKIVKAFQDSEEIYESSGALVSPFLVITSAFNVPDKDSSVLIYFGPTANAIHEPGDPVLQVEREDFEYLSHNLVAVKLPVEIPIYADYTEFVRVGSRRPRLGERVFVTGWGETHWDSSADTLQGVFLERHKPNEKYLQLRSDEFAATSSYKYNSRRNACFGDFGAPAVCDHGTDQATLCGVVHGLWNPYNSNRCDGGFTILIDVTMYRHKIEELIQFQRKMLL